MTGETSAPFRYYAYDAVSEDFIEELPLSSVDFSEVSNRPGGFSASMSADHPKATRNNLEPLATVIYVDRGGLIVGHGWVQVLEPNFTAGTVRIGGEGLWAYYRDDRRRIRSRQGMTYATGTNDLEVTFTDVDVFNIVDDLVSHAAVEPGNLGFADVRFHGPGVGGLSGSTRSATYWTYEQKNIGDAIEALAAQDPGFDFAVNCEWVGGSIVRYLDLYYPRRGVNSGALIFEDRKNVSLLKWTLNGKKTANVVTANGAGQGDALKTGQAIATDLIAPAGRYPRLERSTTYRDEASTTNLNAHAVADLAALKLPVETIELELVEGIDASLSSFGLGDTGHVIANRGGFAIDDDYRVESRRTVVDVNGKAKITATLATEAASLGTS